MRTIPAVLAALSLAASAAFASPAAHHPAAVTPDSSWTAAARAALLAREYEFTAAGEGWTAPNRAQDLRVAIDRAGASLTSRTRGDSAFSIRLAWTALGRGANVAAVPEGRLRHENGRVWSDREALDATEWFANDRAGLEQGFVLRRAPESGARREPVVLALDASGAGAVDVAADGRSATFHAPDGATAFFYAQLHVIDAAGEDVPAAFARTARGLEIRVDDAGAAYPLTVDPLATTPQATLQGSQADMQFGMALATAGDVNGDGYSDVIVGAWQYDQTFVNEGAAFVYLGGPNGLSTSPAWFQRGNQLGACYGVSVSTAGDVNNDGYDDVLVGAFLYDVSFTDEGAAFAYLGGSGGLSTTPTWIRGGGLANAYFGDCVSTAGDVNGDGFADVIVGAPHWTNPTDREGAAFLFVGGSIPPLQSTATWQFESNSLALQFGWSVGCAGDVNGDGYDDVFIGAPAVPTLIGYTYVFHGSAASPYLPTLSPSWIETDGQIYSKWGYTVCGIGDMNGDGYSDLCIGAPNFAGGQAFEGRIAIYHGSGSGLDHAPALLESNVANAYFGSSVATAGDVNGDGYADLLVGEPVFGGPGTAFVYGGGPGAFNASPIWSVTTAVTTDLFANVVATAGDVNGDGFSDVLVGAGYSNLNGSTLKSGAAYCYLGGSQGISTTATWNAYGQLAQDVLGWSVSGVGDVNGDGYGDVAVGAPGWDAGSADGGAVFVYYGNATGVAASPSWQRLGAVAGENMGVCVAPAGDVNNDGYGDLLVASHTWNNIGRVQMWKGNLGGLPAGSAIWSASGPGPTSYFGYRCGSAGDLNGDGLGDIFVSASGYDGTLTDQGYACVYLGQGGTLAATPAWSDSGGQAGAQFGSSVAGGGDVNRDGLSDLVVGASGWDNGTDTDAGRVSLYYGIADGNLAGEKGLRHEVGWTHTVTGQNSALFGASTAMADVNGDGFSDVLVGFNGWDSSIVDAGRVEAFFGGAFGLPATASWAHDGDEAYDGYGAAISSAGDVDDDGFTDLLVGAVFHDGAGGPDCGRVYLYRGGAAGLAANASWTVDGLAPYSNVGHIVAPAGDVNGDGFADVMVGEPGYDVSFFDYRAGHAALYLGNQQGIPRQIFQYQACPSLCLLTTVSTLGRAASPGIYGELRPWTAKGRGRVRMQMELKGRNQVMNGSGTTLTAWGLADLGAPFPMGLAASSAAVNDPSHWRARILSKSPYFPRTPWFSMPGNGVNEGDFRMNGPVLAVEPAVDAAELVALAPGAPNPTRGGSRLSFTLPHGGMARLTVQDVQGRRVRTLVDGWRPAGPQELLWDGNDGQGVPTPAGVYFVRLEAMGREVGTRVTRVR